MDAHLADVRRRTPVVGLLRGVRVPPEVVAHLVHGEWPDHGPSRARLHDLAELARPTAGDPAREVPRHRALRDPAQDLAGCARRIWVRPGLLRSSSSRCTRRIADARHPLSVNHGAMRAYQLTAWQHPVESPTHAPV